MNTIKNMCRAIFVSIIACLVFTSLNQVSVQAQASDSAAQGIQISPVLVDLNAEKGQSYNLVLTVTNVTTQELLLKASVNDFQAKDETGNPEVILEDTSGDSSYSFRQWVNPIGDMVLAPKESRVVNATVNVPQNAEAGGYYGVIRFTGTPTDKEKANLTISASVGTLILTRVGGDIQERLVMQEFFAQKNGKKGDLFEAGPLSLVQRIENTGNVHLKPTGSITVKDIFGKTIATEAINATDGNVLPNSTRRFEEVLSKQRLLGRYTATAEIAYGTTGGVLLASTTFWVIPYKLIILVLVALLITVWIVRRILKLYKKRVIAQSKNDNTRQR